ncbi:dimethylmenaquinone methyltransferase [Mycolicibacterium mageritense DSM 44476 = CIP 104973]|uniref:Putative 4-hydroxy-4-methyl-2-oxoglutarate aldolase n=1 Tax=Mycolicibacterium mageritense TaxID=53462 RepID=A0ABN5Y3T8_MYCME|nr:RraA family protein [Mycolicibacterium mageritense]MCC9184454.1 RraA family protein [Mycolicibacterium mageritense]BBX32316.1 methyltransferase [Mycolicibacterium mageritense]CDO23142.1 4-carboxy-4-hydroxy-2-oxoadipate aldolase [Mycolicibacterium mageritense DSM 44476 = CIP 104973]
MTISATENAANRFRRPSAELLESFAKLPTANVADAMDRLGALDSRIKPVWAGATIVGPAFTVWTRAGDNKFLHEALRLAAPGDVLVVNGEADESRALIGELMAERAKTRGIAGFVIDGAVRDADTIGEIEVPVFARAITPAGPYKHGPGRLACTVAVGGVAVIPGDIVLGDSDGVVVVPQGVAAEVLTRAEAKFADETARRADIKAGRK